MQVSSSMEVLVYLHGRKYKQGNSVVDPVCSTTGSPGAACFKCVKPRSDQDLGHHT